ncbi:hypothetical protein C1752_01491 [Acaryochloris thomasi RCC1774]|uniref:Uncharacterized protein n=1 Tax=Acaryochloris thomasi RCC1774 TaxID=1764569 RepID=A0A2W1JM58_9CYAN|nr:hypothetical protein [Acaryochloris thomasi]PZD74296.1 hypothetical protein C1752_01491 [Acaryochloris thomasi RCC1774]
MSEQISNLLYGVIGGGIASTSIKLVENYWIGPRLNEQSEARKQLFRYGKPLWYACQTLQHRLSEIEQKMDSPRTSLAASPRDAQSLSWYTTKHGNYISSSAYMLAVASFWIISYERDVVYLNFGRKSLTANFQTKIENFKDSVSNRTSLWLNYLNGIGEQLAEEGSQEPISFSNFCIKLLNEEIYLEYYMHLFDFLSEINQGKFRVNIRNTVIALFEIKDFLLSNRIAIQNR